MARIPMRSRAAIFKELEASLAKASDGTFTYAKDCNDTSIAAKVGVTRQIVTNMRIAEFGKLYKSHKSLSRSDGGMAVAYGTLCEMVRNNEDMILALRRELDSLKAQLGVND